METTELETHGIHLKMWERRCSQGLDSRSITLQLNESAIVLHSVEKQLENCTRANNKTMTTWSDKYRNKIDILGWNYFKLETIFYLGCDNFMNTASPLLKINKRHLGHHNWTTWTSFFFYYMVFLTSVIPTHLPRYFNTKVGSEQASVEGSSVTAILDHAKSTWLPKEISW